MWLRLLILVFGATLFATSAILSTFMAGLAAGAYLGGRLMDRAERVHPLRAYGWIELGIAAYAAAVPWLLELWTPVYGLLWQAGAQERFVLFSVAKFAGAALVLLPPTMLMGASLPVLARQVTDDPAGIGARVGTLYAANTFGAVAGTCLAGFFLLPHLGLQRSLHVTLAVNAAVGLAALGLARRVAPAPGWGTPEARVAPPPGRHDLLARWGVVAFGLSGFVAMALEVAWTRGLALVFGSSVYAFSLMLVVFLVGLAAGSAFAAAWLRRAPVERARRCLIGALATAGLAAYATSFVFEVLPRLFAQAYFAWQPGPTAWWLIQLGLAGLVMLPATLAFGTVFPAVLQIYGRDLDRVSGSVGTVYAANTVGTIAGAAASGFVLIPAIGVRDTLVAVAALEVALGLVLLLVAPPARSRRLSTPAVALAAALACVLLVRPPWNPLLMNSGVYMNLQDLPEGSGWEDFRSYTMESTVPVYVRDGLTATVFVGDQPAYDNRFLSVNGKVEASTRADMETQLLCAHLPLLLVPNPRDVMIVGLASGITAGAAATHPVETIRVVEIEPAVIPAARLFAKHNGNVLEDPRVTVSVNDARNELQFSPRTYDAIVSEPSNPWMTVAANLFTEEFFRLSRARLRPGGIHSQWVQTYYLPPEDLRSVVAAFRAAYPHVFAFSTMDGVDLLLLGSDRPFLLDLERMRRRMQELRVRLDLARIGVRKPEDLLPLLALGPDGVDRLVAGAERNTDDSAKVEFSAARAIYTDTVELNRAFLQRFRGDPLRWASAAAGPAALRLELARGLLAREREAEARQVLEPLLQGEVGEQARALLEKLRFATTP